MTSVLPQRVSQSTPSKVVIGKFLRKKTEHSPIVITRVYNRVHHGNVKKVFLFIVFTYTSKYNGDSGNRISNFRCPDGMFWRFQYSPDMSGHAKKNTIMSISPN